MRAVNIRYTYCIYSLYLYVLISSLSHKLPLLADFILQYQIAEVSHYFQLSVEPPGE